MSYQQYGNDQRRIHPHWPPAPYLPMRAEESVTAQHFGRAPHLQVHVPSPYAHGYSMHPPHMDVPRDTRPMASTPHFPLFYEPVGFRAVPAHQLHPYSAPPYPTARFPSRASYGPSNALTLPRFYPGVQVQPVFEPAGSRLPPAFQTHSAPRISPMHLRDPTTTNSTAQKPDTAPFPVTPPLSETSVQTITLAPVLPGNSSEASNLQNVSGGRKSLIVKLPAPNWPHRLSNASFPAVECIKVTKRKRQAEVIEPSRAGADSDQLHIPALGDQLGSSHKKLRSLRAATRQNVAASQVADAHHPTASPALAGAAQTNPEAGSLTPMTNPSPSMQVTAVANNAATDNHMLPTPPSERDEAGPRTPARHTRQSVRQFSPGLYGREQPKRRAKREPAAPKPIPTRRPSVRRSEVYDPAVSLPQLDGVVDDHIPNTRGAKRKRADQKRSKATEKRDPTNHKVAERTPEITMGAAISTSGRSTSSIPAPTCPMPGCVVTSHRETSGDVRAIPDPQGDQDFVQRMLHSLQEQVNSDTANVHKNSAIRMLPLLQKAEFPTADEAKFLNGQEAKDAVARNVFFNGPIVTAEQQGLELQTVDQFLEEFYEQDVQIWIQDSSTGLARNQAAVRQVKISQVKERLQNEPTEAPWNCLELATHHDEGLRPSFLQTEDCRLLTKLKIPGAANHTRRRMYPTGYKEIEKWALLAEAGALTTPHQDSHGYSTFITVNFGRVGFAWLSHPTAEERAQWCKNPLRYDGGRWRYIVLKPGQTIFFPAGTVHMVFRLPTTGHTLAFGGHVLRNSNIVHWVKTLIEERENTNVTNEDLTSSSTGYLDRVEKFVNEAVQRGETEKWGGMESIEEFLRLKKEFMKRKPTAKQLKEMKQTRKTSAKAS